MELREVMGRRRSIRFLNPHKPVEPEKIQMMFEASRIASHWGNVQSLRGIAVFRDSAPKEVAEAVTSPIAGYQIRLAPVSIVWFLDTAAVDAQADRIRELCKVGALGYGEGKEQAIEDQLIPIFKNISETTKAPGLGELDCGQGIAQATLMAFDLGLGTCCLGTPHGEQIRQNLGMPESCRILLIQTVGYPLESPEAGGQRPRLPFEDLFHLNGYDKPFPRSQEVVEELTRDEMFQAPAPLPWREAELEFLRKALDLPGNGLL
ncbi:MAG: nitroreductase family protein [Deltaproteobacteria bacterium]|nr:nitroreductase family protein [Deltaproteobacteria bacterium]